MKALFRLLLITLLIGVFSGVSAAEYPKKPITIVAPYDPGGASDIAARTLASVTPKYIDESVIVVNRTGGAGVTGTTYVTKGKKDGYTLLLSRIGNNAVLPALNETIPYKWNDFTFLGLLELNPLVFVVRADSPYTTLDELGAALKANPGKMRYSTSGPISVHYIGVQMFMNIIGLDKDSAIAIPYKGGGGGKIALLGGHVDFQATNLAAVSDQIQAGKLRGLAVTTPERCDTIPNVPTVREIGYPDLEKVIGWSGLCGPPGLPQDVIDFWTTVLQKVKTDENWNRLTKNVGSIPYILSGDDTERFVKDQYESYNRLGKKLGLIIK
jgi:tripartite-type tricarboxylate transporter receptor subunit TctC